MSCCRRLLPLIIPLIFAVTSCSSQDHAGDRKPAVAGQFYPADAGDLRSTITDLFAKAVPSKGIPNVLAILVPHAGYVFSGVVAASGYNQIDAEREYDNVFVIGPSHYVGFEGAAVYTSGDFLTPLGRVTVNRELGERLAHQDPLFSTRTDAQAREHSVEVQIPFLQKILKKEFRIVPIVVGENSPATCKKLAGILRPFLNDRNLFVISTDFSHYPSYDDAVRVDKATADAILANSPDGLVDRLQQNDESAVPNLATSLCGRSAVLTLLSMTAGTDLVFTPVVYKNSGDAGITDKRQVVGYWAITVSRKNEPVGFMLDETDRAALLTLARQSIASYLESGRATTADPARMSDALKTNCGAFVTLNEHANLRGCIGRFDPGEPLYKVVQQMAIASAIQDTRFSPVQSSELKDIVIEISVLTPMKKISSIDEFELGRDGIYIKKGYRSGTFLPQVAKETGWTKEEFFGHCAQDKAGIGWDGWKDAELFTYEALVFGEK